MQTQKLEGTFILEGLIEGTLADESVADDLRSWEHNTRHAGIGLNLQIESNHFNALPDTQPGKVSKLSAGVSDSIVSKLEELLEIFPEGWRPGITSTLRSREYSPNQETQTLYIITPDGKVVKEQRSVDAVTVKPPAPVSRREIIMMSAAAVGILAVLLLILSFFFDFRGILTNAKDSILPYKSEELVIDTASFNKYLIPVKTEIDKGFIKIHLAPAFPLKFEDSDVDQLHSQARTLREKLAVEDIVRQHLRVLQLDRENKIISDRIVPLEFDLETATFRLAVEIPRRGRTVTVKLGL